MEREQKKAVRIELTAEQRKLIKQQTGRDADAIEFAAEELEERIAPAMIGLLGGNYD